MITRLLLMILIALLFSGTVHALVPMAWELTSKYAGSKVGKGWE